MVESKTKWYLLFAIIAALAAYCVADVCSNQPQGNLAACYTNRASCHYSLATNACTNPAPINCVQFLSDQTGCTASTFNCTFNTSNQQCIAKPGSCGLINTTLACSQRSDCQWFNNTCKPGTTICGNTTSFAICSASSCLWDPYLSQCFDDLSEVTVINPCSSWSSYPQPNTACAFHGCQLDVTGYICMNAGSFTGNITAVTDTFSPLFVNPIVIQASYTFEVQVWIPNQIRLYPAYWVYISIGGGIAGYSNDGAFKPSICNDVKSYNQTIGPPQYTAVADPVGLQNYFNSWVTTYGSLNFSAASNATFGSVLASVIGPLNTGPGLFVRNVAIDPTGNYYINTVSGYIPTLLQNCSAYGATALYTTTGIYISFPLVVAQRSYLNSYIESDTNFYIIIPTTGVITTGASSSYQPSISRTEVLSVTSNCPAGQAREVYTYLLSEGAVYDGYYVGPRNISDILWTSPIYNNTLENCYNETVTSLTPLGLFNSAYLIKFTSQTACRPIAADGLAFNLCSRALDTDRIALMGGNFSFPSSLNGKHSVYINNYRCPGTANFLNGYAGCTLAVQTPTGAPDEYPIFLSLLIYPQTTVNVQYSVTFGLLPTPTDLNIGDLEILSISTSTGTNITATDTYNAAMRWNGVITPVIEMLASLTNIATLIIDITQFSITPTDPYGVPIPGGRILYWGDVAPYMLYVPSIAKIDLYCTTCTILPVTVNITSTDGFAIPVLSLRGLSPGNGYLFNFNYYFTMPQPTQTANSGLLSVVERDKTSRRRLLDATTTTTTTTTTRTTGSTTIFISIDETNNPNPLPSFVNVTLPNTTNTIVQSLQVQMHIVLDTSTGINTADVNAVKAYMLQYLPGVVAQSYNIQPTQVVDIDVITDTSQVVLSKPNTRSKISVKKKKTKKTTRYDVMSLTMSAYYVSFVILPSANGTLISLNQFNSNSSLTLFTVDLLNVGLALDTTQLVKVITVYVSPTGWNTTVTVTQSGGGGSGNTVTTEEAGISFLIWFVVPLIIVIVVVYVCVKRSHDERRNYQIVLDSVTDVKDALALKLESS